MYYIEPGIDMGFEVDNLWRGNLGAEISRAEIKEKHPLFPLAFLEKHFPDQCGKTKKNGRIFYDKPSLVSLGRMITLPGFGKISTVPIRHAEIIDLVYSEEDPAKIKEVKTAAAFLQNDTQKHGRGSLAFICPFCGSMHFHGAGDIRFKDGDGIRVPHCVCRDPQYLRRDTQHISEKLADTWYFDLVEVKEFRRAGHFPNHLHLFFYESLTTRRDSQEG